MDAPLPTATDLPARPAAPGRPVFARHAASLLLVRHGPAGPAVLMGVRTTGHRFLPGRLVFPGGAVDLADRTAPAASEPRPELLAILRRSVGPLLARGIVMAAARELQEETGLSFGDPPHLATMNYLCRAITPSRSAIRFNARFLFADAADTAGEPGDSRELQDVRFVPLADTGALDLMHVTRWALEVLAQRLAQPEAREPSAEPLLVFRGERPRADRNR